MKNSEPLGIGWVVIFTTDILGDNDLRKKRIITDETS